jgi:hypothetical protein
MIDLKPDHVGGLAFEIRIIGGHVTLELGCRSALSGSLRKLFASLLGSIRVCAGAGPRYRYDRLGQPLYTVLNATTLDFAHATPLMMS